MDKDKLENEYESMPAFRALAKSKSVAFIGRCLSKIEDIRYMMYTASFLLNGCYGISEVNWTLDRKQHENFRVIAGSVSHLPEERRIPRIISKVHAEIKKELAKLLNERKGTLSERYGINADVGVRIDWDIIADSRYYNEIDNPSVVRDILDMLFPDTLKTAKYMICIYDFGDYEISFGTREETDEFAKSFVDCGAVYERDETDGNWTELYGI